MKYFSSNFKTYQAWRRGRKLTQYAKRIIALHKKHPKLSLSKLLGLRKPLDFSKIPWYDLSRKNRNLRTLSLKVLSEMRRTRRSLERSSRDYGLLPDVVKSHIKSAIRKRGRRWFAKAVDYIERAMVINEKGRSRTIIVTNSRDGSLIGSYHNAIKKFLETGDESVLKPFKNKVIIDNKGKKHKLETNPKKLYEISEAREDEEFYEIYGD